MWIALDTWALDHGAAADTTLNVSTTPLTQGPCGRGHYAARTVGGVSYFVYAAFAPDAILNVRRAVDDTWRSLSSSGPGGLYLTRGTVDGYVLASGSAGGAPWLLTSSVFGDPLSLLAGAEAGPQGFTGATVPATDLRGGFRTAVGHGQGGERVIAVASDPSRSTPVFRPADGMWYTRLSRGNFDTARGLQWGLTGDAPVPPTETPSTFATDRSRPSLGVFRIFIL